MCNYPFGIIKIYKNNENQQFLLWNDIKNNFPLYQRQPIDARSIDIDWDGFRDWHSKNMAQRIHHFVKRALLVNRELINWLWKYNKAVSEQIEKFL